MVNDLDEACLALKSGGVEFVVAPSQPRPGVRTAFIRAPAGVLLEIVEMK
jgi:catechol 2,3-dioxygenase-like lactoylglutathione lyase family enzyme